MNDRNNQSDLNLTKYSGIESKCGHSNKSSIPILYYKSALHPLSIESKFGHPHNSVISILYSILA
jgi:hypothetical protein